MRILVTGGCGYVGSHVIQALVQAKSEVVVVDDLSSGHLGSLPPDVTFVKADVRDARLARTMKEERVEAIVHLAARIEVGESVRDPRKYYDNNVIASLELFAHAIDAGVKAFVLSSSAAVYGDPKEVPIPEHHPLAPASPYGESKRVLEEALSSYARAYGISYCALRYFNAAGATPELELGERHEPESHLIPLAVGAALGTRPPLFVFGADHDTPDGTCVRDFVHVKDLADAHVRALDYLRRGGESGAVNLGTGRGASVREVLEAIARATGAEVPHAVAARRPGDPAVLVASYEKAARLFGWTPAHDLDAIVRDAVAFERLRASA